MEIWKSIKDYPDYQISNLGNVKSFKFGKERVLKPGICHGYFNVTLRFKRNSKTITVHQLVAEYFLNHKPDGYKLVVNHKDLNRTNNNVNNLEIVTPRENTNKKHLKSRSKYIGVCWHSQQNKWYSRIFVNGKSKNLGLFTNELDAHNAYQKALTTIII